MNNKKNLFFLLCIVLLSYRVDLIGSISITELYLFTQVPKLWRWAKTSGFPILAKMKKLFVFLILSQVLSEIVIHNTFVNALKGIMITVMALFVILFVLYEILEKRASLIMVPLGMIIAQLIFGDQFGYVENGDESVWFKFYVVPLVMNGACVLFLLNNKWVNRNVVFIFLASSMFMMIGGSRTGGFTMLLALMLYLAAKRSRRLSWSKLLRALIPLMIVGELFYAFVYVPNVKSGEWGSEQNRKQMAVIDYSPNALMLVMAARHDFFVSFAAFMDKPIWGHGAWAKDETLKYALLSAKMSDADDDKVVKSAEYLGTPLVPAHSILVAMGSRNGILAFIAFCCIFVLVYKVSFRLLMQKPPYLPYVCYLIIGSIQAVLFSPPAILKGNVAVMWATLLALYFMNLKKTENEIISSNSNI